MVIEGLVDGSEDLLSDVGSVFDGVGAVHQYLGLDDWDEAVGLADGGIAGKGHGILDDGNRGRGGTSGVVDVEDSTPLGETGTSLVVGGTSLIEVVETLGDGLTVGAVERGNTLVDLDTGDDVLGLEEGDEGGSIRGGLVKGLLVQDYSRDMLLLRE